MSKKSQKRERSSNFNTDETDLLVKLVEQYKHILENKKSDSHTWSKKKKCWNELKTQFNSASGITYRSAKTLKLKYEGIKREIRKKAASIRAETYRTGGAPSTAPVLTPAEEKVKEIIFLSIDDMESTYDSDQEQTDNMVLKLDTENVFPENDKNNKNTRGSLEEEHFITPKRLKTKSDDDLIGPNKWSNCKPASLRSRKYPALGNTRVKKSIDKLIEVKLENAKLQKKILLMELENKEDEKEHKRQMWALEKQLLLNKIEKLS